MYGVFPSSSGALNSSVPALSSPLTDIGKAKISRYRSPTAVQEKVLRLHVPMDDSAVIQVLHDFDHLKAILLAVIKALCACSKKVEEPCD